MNYKKGKENARVRKGGENLHDCQSPRSRGGGRKEFSSRYGIEESNFSWGGNRVRTTKKGAETRFVQEKGKAAATPLGDKKKKKGKI